MFLPVQLAGILLSYGVLLFAVPWFFKEPLRRPGKQSVISLALILILMGVITWVVFSIPSEFWGNRIQHAFGGGFLMLFVCVRAFHDSGTRIDPIRFFLIAGMLVTTLGVASEIIEFFFQMTTPLVFADSIYDSWLDLLSNAVGATLGGLVFAPFISSRK